MRALPNKYIYFIPDQHLGQHVAEKVPEKKFIFNDGYCPIHRQIRKEDVLRAKEEHPDAAFLFIRNVRKKSWIWQSMQEALPELSSTHLPVSRKSF